MADDDLKEVQWQVSGEGQRVLLAMIREDNWEVSVLLEPEQAVMMGDALIRIAKMVVPRV